MPLSALATAARACVMHSLRSLLRQATGSSLPGDRRQATGSSLPGCKAPPRQLYDDPNDHPKQSETVKQFVEGAL